MLHAHLHRMARGTAWAIALMLTSGGYADDSTSDVAAWIGITPESMVVAQFDVPQATAVLNALDESSELRGAIADQHAQADAASDAVTTLSESLQANPDDPDLLASFEEASTALAAAQSQIEALRNDLFAAAVASASEAQRQRLIIWRSAGDRRIPAEARVQAHPADEWQQVEAAVRAERRALRRGEELDTEQAALLNTIRSHPDVVQAAANLQANLAPMKVLFQQFDS